jgi:Lon protease-like protein
METSRIPIFPLGLVLLPEMVLPLHIFEERYKRMTADCMAGNQPFGIVWFDGQDIHFSGCTARVVKVLHRYEDGRMDILTRGERRFVVQELIEEKAYMEARVSFFEDTQCAAGTGTAAAMETARSLLKALSEAGEPIDLPDWRSLNDPGRFSFAIAAMEGVTHAERQVFLEMTSSAERLEKSVEALAKIVERLQLTKTIQKIIGGNGHPPDSSIRKLMGTLS